MFSDYLIVLHCLKFFSQDSQKKELNERSRIQDRKLKGRGCVDNRSHWNAKRRWRNTDVVDFMPPLMNLTVVFYQATAPTLGNLPYLIICISAIFNRLRGSYSFTQRLIRVCLLKSSLFAWFKYANSNTKTHYLESVLEK